MEDDERLYLVLLFVILFVRILKSISDAAKSVPTVKSVRALVRSNGAKKNKNRDEFVADARSILEDLTTEKDDDDKDEMTMYASAPSSPTPNMAPPKHPPPTPMKPRRTSARLRRSGEEEDHAMLDFAEESEDEVYFDNDDDRHHQGAGTKDQHQQRKKKLPTRRKLEDAFDRIVEKKGGKSKILDPFEDFEEEYENENVR